MLICKGFSYRIYPTLEQVERLRQWENALRFLWNLALEQRLMGLARPKDERKFPTAFDQINELTDLRSELPWLADVPRNVCAQLLVELDKAWQRCFKRLGRKPRFKRKGKDVLGLTEPHPKTWRLDSNNLRFPKLGDIEIVVHRPLEGKAKICTIRRDGDQWFASIVCELEVPEPLPSDKPAIALDRGVVNLIADSNGRVVANPKHLEESSTRLAKAQRVVARRKKGSRNQARAKVRVMRLHRKVRRQREHVLHVESHRIANSHGRVIVEKLNVKAMSASSKGTVEEPGTDVQQKSGLNRSILDAGWSLFVNMLGYKLAWNGGELVEVRAAYSSQTCSACGHVDAVSRITQAQFRCTRCGHTDNADVNAAKVLYSRGTHGSAGCGGSAVGRPAKQQLRVARRGTRSSQGLGSNKAPAFRSG